MGMRAQRLFAEQGINVVVGVRPDRPSELVKAYMAGTLRTGPNVCDH
jgi:hypothetical protein